MGGEAPTTVKLWLPPGERSAAAAAGVPRLSRDGRRAAAVLVRDGIERIHVLDLDTGVWARSIRHGAKPPGVLLARRFATDVRS
jgi:hypothetical protein